jgi:hypothetical protein
MHSLPISFTDILFSFIQNQVNGSTGVAEAEELADARRNRMMPAPMAITMKKTRTRWYADWITKMKPHTTLDGIDSHSAQGDSSSMLML